MSFGVLVVAHGSSKAGWVSLVDELMESINLDIPLEVGYLEMVENRDISNGVSNLEKRGVTKLLIIPLFVSSGSTHIDEIEEIFENSSNPLMKNAIISEPMDSDDYIINLLMDRVFELERDIEDKSILFIGHGSKENGYREKWQVVLDNIKDKVMSRLNMKNIYTTSIYSEDFDATLKEASKNKIVVIPLFLAEGYFTKQVIPSKLQGYNYSLNHMGYLPSNFVKKWLLKKIKQKT